jgi:cyanophycin synthetase
MSDIWDTTEPAAQAFFRFRRQWRPLAGFGLGLREPAIIGQARVSLPENFDLAALEARMLRYIKEKPEGEAPGEMPAEKLVRRAMFWIAALQRQLQIPVFGSAFVSGPRKSERGGEAFRLAAPYFAPQATMLASQWVGMAINNFLVSGRLRGASREEARRQFAEASKAIQKFAPGGVNTYRILSAAHELDIPARRVLANVFAFGTGARMRWMQSSFTDRTSLLASRFAGNKFMTAEILRKAGLPAPTHSLVKSEEEAVKVAHQLGYPVVVKPADRQQGRGVAANLVTDEAVAAAYRDAAGISKNILVEKHFEGTDYRMSVLDGKIFRISARLPGGITGDGKSTVAELVDQRQQSEEQQLRARERGHNLIELDGEAMQLLLEAGLSPESVLPEGQYQRLRRKGNVSAGGTPRRIQPQDAHPDNIRLAERAVTALRLDLGGVDVILPDISRSWLETGGLICEVNAQPQLGPRNMPDLLSRMLEGDGRIPVLLVIGDGAGLDRQRLADTGRKAGFASADGIWLGTDQLAGKQPNGFAAAQALGANPQTEMAIVVMSPSEVLMLGLPFDRCDLLVLEAPDRWNSTDREALSDLLEIALPQARKTVYLQPAHALLGSQRAAGRLEPAGAETLQQICEEFVSAATKAGAADTSSPRPLVAAG